MPLFKRNDIFAGRYELSGLTGKGPFSEVWKARDQMADGAVVSLKIFANMKGPADEAVPRFKRQFSIAQQLSHPHLLKISYYDVSEGLPYLVMPFCPGGSLANIVHEKGPLSEKQIALILCQTGSALETLHQQEPPLLHGNVKPENILAAQDDYFLLSDFGTCNTLSGHLGGSPSACRSASPAYAPPESFDRFRKTDASADIFSLGVTLYEAATNSVPWAGKGGKAMLQGEKVPVLPKRYSAELDELFQACMSADKNKRPAAKELHLRGKQFLETGRWTISETDGAERKHLKKLITRLSVAAAVLLLIAGAYWGIQNQYFTVPTAGLSAERDSGSEDREQDIDEMLIATLEDQLEDMTSRARELEEENQQLKQSSDPGKAEPENSPREEELSREENPRKEISGRAKSAEAKNVVSPSITSPVEKTSPASPDEFQKQLNKVSDPAFSGKAREAWRKEMLAQFAEGSVRILDETDGTPKRFSTRIFINLLYRVPHTVVVKEVKRDQNKKVSELRLEMQPKG